jgi:type I restriction enzyme S subunit
MSEPTFIASNQWGTRLLSEVATINPETLGAQTPRDFGFGYVDISSVSNGVVNWQTVADLIFATSPSRARRRIRNGDVLFGTVRPANRSHGFIHYQPRELVASTGFAIIRAIVEAVSPRFLFHLILGNDIASQARRLEVGSNYPAVNEGDVAKFQVLLPPLPEQRRIAEILDTLDEAIRKAEQVITKLQLMKQGLLHDLLTRGVDENGELRHPERHPDQFKESELGRIPRGWEVLRVGSALESIEQGWSPNCDTEAARKGQWGVIKTTSVTWAGYEDSANKSLPQHLPPRPEYEVRCEDVLMTRAGPNSRVGVVALVSATQGKLMLSDKLYRLSPKTEQLTPAFLALALSGEQTQRHLSTLKTGLAESQTNISQAIVRSLWIATPDLSEQERIYAIHAELARQVQTVNFSLSKLRSLKEGLMDDLLAGRVRIATHDEDKEE